MMDQEEAGMLPFIHDMGALEWERYWWIFEDMGIVDEMLDCSEEHMVV